MVSGRLTRSKSDDVIIQLRMRKNVIRSISCNLAEDEKLLGVEVGVWDGKNAGQIC